MGAAIWLIAWLRVISILARISSRCKWTCDQFRSVWFLSKIRNVQCSIVKLCLIALYGYRRGWMQQGTENESHKSHFYYQASSKQKNNARTVNQRVIQTARGTQSPYIWYLFKEVGWEFHRNIPIPINNHNLKNREIQYIIQTLQNRAMEVTFNLNHRKRTCTL